MRLITEILKPYKDQLGLDYDAYHHHAQRVYQYAITFLLVREREKIAIAAAFHDLDIWVSGSMNYLNGSVQLCKEYLAQTESGILPDEIAFFIQQHHKIRPILGNEEAEAFRKADLVDLSGGRIHFNLPKSIIWETEQNYSRLGFSKIMLRKSLLHAFKNLQNPFPMIKW